MDNGTMVEAFKFLNYCQLATSSHVSKRFWDLIRTHRHKLALLDVGNISMHSCINPTPSVIKMFNEELSTEQYNEWVASNGYSKLIPFDFGCGYEFRADVYQNPNHNHDFAATVFIAKIELKNETWPLFQHLIRLLMDPFIYIRNFVLYKVQKEAFNLLAGEMNPDRLHCNRLYVRLNVDTMQFVAWIKDHMRCDKIEIDVNSRSNYDQVFLDLFLTGAQCTSAISNNCYDLSKVIVNFVQKFISLKHCDEYQVIELIHGNVEEQDVVEVLKRNCAELIEEEQNVEDFRIKQVVGFINNDIKKKLSVRNFILNPSSFSIKITNL